MNDSGDFANEAKASYRCAHSECIRRILIRNAATFVAKCKCQTKIAFTILSPQNKWNRFRCGVQATVQWINHIQLLTKNHKSCVCVWVPWKIDDSDVIAIGYFSPNQYADDVTCRRSLILDFNFTIFYFCFRAVPIAENLFFRNPKGQ